MPWWGLSSAARGLTVAEIHLGTGPTSHCVGKGRKETIAEGRACIPRGESGMGRDRDRGGRFARLISPRGAP